MYEPGFDLKNKSVSKGENPSSQEKWLFQLAPEPGPGQPPIALNRSMADIEDNRRFLNRKAAEKSQLDGSGVLWVKLRQTPQGRMHGQPFHLWLYVAVTVAGKQNAHI